MICKRHRVNFLNKKRKEEMNSMKTSSIVFSRMEHSGKWIWMFHKNHFIFISFCLIKERKKEMSLHKHHSESFPEWNILENGYGCLIRYISFTFISCYEGRWERLRTCVRESGGFGAIWCSKDVPEHTFSHLHVLWKLVRENADVRSRKATGGAHIDKSFD